MQLEASAPPGDGDWDVVNNAVSGSSIPLGTDGLLTIKVTWEGAPAQGSFFTRGGSNTNSNPDVDLSAIVFGKDGSALEAVYFNHTRTITSNGGIELVSGDQNSGQVGEELRIRLQSLPALCHTIALVVTSANSIPLSAVEGICMSATLSQQTSSFTCDHLTWPPQEFPSSPVSSPSLPPHSVSIPLTLVRNGGRNEWKLNVVTTSIPNAHTFVDALPKIRRVAELPEGATTNFKIPVVLQKGDELLLQGDQVECPIHVGCGWDELPGDGEDAADADLSVLFYGDDVGDGPVETIYWGKLSAFDGAVVHSGDNTTGEGEGDDESTVINLNAIPSIVKSIAFLVTNYNEGGLSRISNVHFRIVRLLDEAEIVRYDHIGTGGTGSYSGFIPCTFHRTTAAGGGRSSGAWKIVAHSAPISGGNTVHDPQVKKVVAKVIEGGVSGGPTVKPVNLRKSLQDLPENPSCKDGGSGTSTTTTTTAGRGRGKNSAPLPDQPPTQRRRGSPPRSGGDSNKKEKGNQQQQQQQMQQDLPLHFKIAIFFVAVMLLRSLLNMG